jgi:hypothetical protein
MTSTALAESVPARQLHDAIKALQTDTNLP